MKAKDRVKRIRQKAFTEYQTTHFLAKEPLFNSGECHEYVEMAIFKAGYDKGRTVCPTNEVQGNIYLEGKQDGIREVVEWRLEPCPHRSHNAKYFKPRCACEKCWQIKLKELEADNELQD